MNSSMSQVNLAQEAVNESDVDAAKQAKRAAANLVRRNQQAYALATFVFGCLVREEVLHFDPNNSDDMSDMQVGIRIIAACIKNYIDTDSGYSLPFEW